MAAVHSPIHPSTSQMYSVDVTFDSRIDSLCVCVCLLISSPPPSRPGTYVHWSGELLTIQTWAGVYRGHAFACCCRPLCKCCMCWNNTTLLRITPTKKKKESKRIMCCASTRVEIGEKDSVARRPIQHTTWHAEFFFFFFFRPDWLSRTKHTHVNWKLYLK